MTTGDSPAGGPTRRLRSRQVAGRLSLLAAGAVLALLAAELLVRTLRPQAVLLVTPGFYAEASPPLRYRLRPGFRGIISNRVEFATPVEITADGLRGPLAPRLPGAFRLLALGDSFTFGVGVGAHEAWPAVVAAELNAQGRPTLAGNAGTPGYGVPDAAAWLSTHGAELAPDLVLVGVFLGNDLQDAAPSAPAMEVRHGLLRVAGKADGWSRWLYYHSHLYALGKSALTSDALVRWRSRLGLAEPRDRRDRRLELELYASGLSPDLSAGLAATESAFAAIRAHADRLGARAGIVLVPSLAQVDARAWQAALSEFALDPAVFDRGRPAGLVAAAAARQEFPVLDCTAVLEAAIERGEVTHYPVDQHLNASGHRLVGAAVAEFVRSWLPGPSTGSSTVPSTGPSTGPSR